MAAWINPQSISGTQTIVRKRLDGTSSFVLAIDGRKLALALKLVGGKTVGVSAGGLTAGKFTHVAATYDGKDAILYVDGVAAGKAHAVGKIAPGAGPILIGNDADGRLLKGIVDTVWLNTLAAPASVVQGLTCLHQPPVVALTPAVSGPQVAGTPVAYDLSVTNANGPKCASATFQYFAQPFFPLSADNPFGSMTLGSGATGHATLNIKSSRQSTPGSYVFQVQAIEAANVSAPPALAQATYVVGTGPIACDGVAPFTPQITGASSGPASAGGLFTYAAPGLIAPTVTPVFDPATYALQALQVSASPGVPTDANNAFLGFGLGFANPACLDASAYNAVKFTVTGDLSTCQLSITLTPSQNNSINNGPFGVCTTPGGCFGPFSGQLTTGVNVVPFTDLPAGAARDRRSDRAERDRLEPDRAQRRRDRALHGELHRQRRCLRHRAVAPRDRAAPSPRGGTQVQAGLDGRSSLRVLVSRALAQPQERSMTNTMVKMMLGTTVLLGVAVVSYPAGAAKAKVAIVTAAPEIKWEPLAGGPMQHAILWGDRNKGPEYADAAQGAGRRRFRHARAHRRLPRGLRPGHLGAHRGGRPCLGEGPGPGSSCSSRASRCTRTSARGSRSASSSCTSTARATSSRARSRLPTRRPLRQRPLRQQPWLRPRQQRRSREIATSDPLSPRSGERAKERGRRLARARLSRT